MKRPLVVIVIALLMASALQIPTALAAPQRLALVIGNGAYASSPLKNPVNDATDMAAALGELGFSVTLLTDASQREMEEAVRNFGKQLQGGGTGLFYFAGHGVQVGGANYLLPVDAHIETEADVKFEAVDASRVLAQMDYAQSDLNIVILDACRNNPFARSFRSAERGLARMDAPTGTYIAYATAPGSVAADGGGRNGIFTQYLLTYMRQPGLDIDDVILETRRAVAKTTNGKQIPWASSSLLGRFYFTPGNAPRQPAPPQAQPLVASIEQTTQQLQTSNSLLPSPESLTFPFVEQFDQWNPSLWSEATSPKFPPGEMEVKGGKLYLRSLAGKGKNGSGIKPTYDFVGDFSLEVELQFPFADSGIMIQNCYVILEGEQTDVSLTIRRDKTKSSTFVEWPVASRWVKRRVTGFSDGFAGTVRVVRKDDEVTFSVRAAHSTDWKEVASKSVRDQRLRFIVWVCNAYSKQPSAKSDHTLQATIESISILSAAQLAHR